MQLPKSGIPRQQLLAQMRERKKQDADWQGGRTWSLVYPAGEDVDEVLRDVDSSPGSSSFMESSRERTSGSVGRSSRLRPGRGLR